MKNKIIVVLCIMFLSYIIPICLVVIHKESYMFIITWIAKSFECSTFFATFIEGLLVFIVIILTNRWHGLFSKKNN
jgi:hypothetical protein